MNRRHLAHLLATIAALVAAVVAIILNTSSTSTTRVAAPPLSAGQAPLGDQQSPTPLKGGPAPRTVHRNAPNEHRLAAPHAVGGAQTLSCPTLYGGHLWSSRNGIRPTEFVIHYTAGNGTAESIDNYFRQTRAASATYLLEPSGHCRQEVPEGEKPWTQLAANPYAISVEIVTTGWNVTRAQWLAMPIFARGYLAELVRGADARHGIPNRHVDPVGCNFIPGYTDHNALECGNDHTDVLPSFPWDVLARHLSGPAPPAAPSAHATALCRALLHYRRMAAHGHHLTAAQASAAGAARRALVRHRYRCDAGRRVAVRKR